MYGDLLGVAKLLRENHTRLVTGKAAQRFALADHLSVISKCISEIILAHRAGESLVMRCRELEVYGEESGALVISILGEERGLKIGKAIKEACYTRRGLAASFLLVGKNQQETVTRVSDLERAAGMLAGTASILKVGNAPPTTRWGKLKVWLIG